MIRSAIVVALALMLSGCVTETNKRLKNAVPAEMVQRQLDLGIGYLRNGDYQRAKSNLQRALDLDPKSPIVHASLGIVFQAEGENDLAEKHYREAIRYDPESAQARNSYGAFLFSMERYAEAAEQLAQASENRYYPNRAVVFENLGRAYAKLGEIDKADYAFTRAVQLNQEQSRALLELAEIRFEQRKFAESRDLYARHVRIAPKSSKALWLCIRLARVFKDNNQEASCATALEGIYPASEEYGFYKESL